MRIVAVIPARLDSKRLPEKVLLPIANRPLLWHVWQHACSSKCFDAVFVATDSKKIVGLVTDWGGKAILTQSTCTCGTERVAEVAADLSVEFVVNIQADMPSIPHGLLKEIRDGCLSGNSSVTTPVRRIMSHDELWNPDLVKVVRNSDGDAVYFSRHPVPFLRDHDRNSWHEHHSYWGHIGIYGISADLLRRYPRLPVTANERAEKLEQLRWLEAGVQVRTFETQHRVAKLDSVADIESLHAK